MENKKILVLDFGSTYNQDIVRKVRNLGVYSELIDYDTKASDLALDKDILGLILTGSPRSVNDKDAFSMDPEIFNMGIPVLGICYGMQLMAHQLGGKVEKMNFAEEGLVELTADSDQNLYTNNETVFMHHGDHVTVLPDGFTNYAYTDKTVNALMINKEKNLFGTQFHPEKDESDVLDNFVNKICGGQNTWTMENYVEMQTKLIQDQIQGDQVILALSGGVDSAVVAALLHHAIGDQLVCIFVDHGLMRKYEPEQVVEVFGNHFKINLIKVDAQDRFLGKLAGVDDPEQKRKIIGNEFIEVFNDETKKLEEAKWLAQGTIYSDVIESGTSKTGKLVKSHHNVGGLPKDMKFKLVEPVRSLFKDEVRELGLVLGLPEHIVYRQPFPGPGLGIRVLGDITKEKVSIVQDSDYILRDEMKIAGLERKVWQYFTVLTGLKSVGVKNNERTYDYTLAIRGVNSVDGMSAEWARIPYEVLDTVSKRILKEVEGVNRIVYDITSKPPATIEWE